MNFKSVIAPSAQDQDYYSSVLSHTKFKIGYQGMEYVSFFDTPERLLKFNIEYNQMLNKDESFVDSALKQKLDDFQEWLDNVILFYSAFVLAESDSKWGFDRKTIEKHCLLTCKMFGIALQDDVNNYYEQFNSLLRDRIRDVKIAGVYSDSKRLWNRKKAKPYYEKSQMHKHNGDLMTIFVLVHFEEMFVKNPAIMKNSEQLMTLMKDFSDCYVKYLNQ